jgi:arylsulfatase A-like enzyme
MARRFGDHARILESSRWKDAVQGYLATITFCDAMVGRLMDAFDQTPYRNETIICLWSDHGWMLGEKEHWRKFALWEEAARAPFLFVVPGMTPPNSACDRTVDYMGIYPTLCDLAGLPIPKHVQGISIKPLLQNPRVPWDLPALTTYLYKNHSVRTERWRYIRYSDGGEELYDHAKDPLEWNNLAKNAQYDEIKKTLAKAMPPVDTPEGGVGTEGIQKGKGKGGGKRKGAN